MQLEFTYELADIRESVLPERFAARPETYGRRWIRPTVTLLIGALFWSYAIWVEGLLPDPWRAISRDTPHDLRTEVLPALIPAFYVCALYVIVICNTWRSSRGVAGSGAATGGGGWGTRVARLSVGAVCGLGMLMAISRNWDPIWVPTRKQLVLVTVAPWLVLIVLTQVLGAFQRRGKVVGPWRSDPALRRPKTVILDDSRFCMFDAHYRSECDWKYFKRVRETKNLLVLVSEGGAEYVIPKRAFADPADLERCRSLLQNVVPNTQFLVKPIGFAVLPKPVLPLPEFGDDKPDPALLTQLQNGKTLQCATEMERQK